MSSTPRIPKAEITGFARVVRARSGSVIARALMMLVGLAVASMGAGMTMLGVFAFVGMPMLIVGLVLIVEAADIRS